MPFSPGLKRGKILIILKLIFYKKKIILGKIFEPKELIDSGFGLSNDSFGLNISEKMQMPIEIDLDDEDYLGVEKLENALDVAPERDLIDLAGILG